MTSSSPEVTRRASPYRCRARCACTRMPSRGVIGSSPTRWRRCSAVDARPLPKRSLGASSAWRSDRVALLAAVIGEVDIPVELSGGIRDDASLHWTLSTGCSRVVLSAVIDGVASPSRSSGSSASGRSKNCSVNRTTRSGRCSALLAEPAGRRLDLGAERLRHLGPVGHDSGIIGRGRRVGGAGSIPTSVPTFRRNGPDPTVRSDATRCRAHGAASRPLNLAQATPT